MVGEITKWIDIESDVNSRHTHTLTLIIDKGGPPEFRTAVGFMLSGMDFNLALSLHDALAVRDALIDLLKDSTPQP